MGGTNAGTVAPVAPQSSGQTIGTMNDLRVHIDPTTNQVHIHDDKAGFKFATPVADFENAWSKGESSGFVTPMEIIGTDGKGQPVTAKFTKVVSGGVLDLAVEIAKASWGPNFAALKNLVDGN